MAHTGCIKVEFPAVLIASDGTRWWSRPCCDEVQLVGGDPQDSHDLYVLVRYWGLTFTDASGAAA